MAFIESAGTAGNPTHGSGFCWGIIGGQGTRYFRQRGQPGVVQAGCREPLPARRSVQPLCTRSSPGIRRDPARRQQVFALVIALLRVFLMSTGMGHA
jgi:hypothetical protein